MKLKINLIKCGKNLNHNIWFFLTLTFVFTSCTSLEKSDDCLNARSLFSKSGLNIDKFRTKPITIQEFEKKWELKKLNKHGLGINNYNLIYQNLEHFSNEDLRTPEVRMQAFAVKSCGFLGDEADLSGTDRHELTWRDRNISTEIEKFKRVESLRQDLIRFIPLLERVPNTSLESVLRAANIPNEWISSTQSRNDILKAIGIIQKIDLSSIYENETEYTFAQTKGALVEDGQSKRKLQIQDAAIKEYSVILLFPYLHPQLSKMLASQTPVRVPDVKAKELCTALAARLGEVDIPALPAHFWSNPTLGNTNRIFSENCESAVRSDGEQNTDVNQNIGESMSIVQKRSIVSDKRNRQALLAHLLITNMSMEVERTSKETFKIKSKLNWADFFKNFPLKELSGFQD